MVCMNLWVVMEPFKTTRQGLKHCHRDKIQDRGTGFRLGFRGNVLGRAYAT